MERAARAAVWLVPLVVVAAACGSAPLDSDMSDMANSRVRFSFADAQTSTGLFVCDEADLARLVVSPEGAGTAGQNRQLSSGEDCSVEFDVTVPKGRVDFAGLLAGGGREIMRGTRNRFPARRDGFVVQVDLEEIDALDVRTRTIGEGGPTTYMLEVEGSTVQIPIDRDASDTLAALAGGPRFVTLHAEPCVVINGPARREVMIPTDEHQLGETLFEIDCLQGSGGPGSGGPGSEPPPRQFGTLLVVVDASQPPLPGEVTTFTAVVTDVAGQIRRGGVAISDSVSFNLPLDRNPYTVDLVPTGSCRVVGASTNSVSIPVSTLLSRVRFVAGC